MPSNARRKPIHLAGLHMISSYAPFYKVPICKMFFSHTSTRGKSPLMLVYFTSIGRIRGSASRACVRVFVGTLPAGRIKMINPIELWNHRSINCKFMDMMCSRRARSWIYGCQSKLGNPEEDGMEKTHHMPTVDFSQLLIWQKLAYHKSFLIK